MCRLTFELSVGPMRGFLSNSTSKDELGAADVMVTPPRIDEFKWYSQHRDEPFISFPVSAGNSLFCAHFVFLHQSFQFLHDPGVS